MLQPNYFNRPYSSPLTSSLLLKGTPGKKKRGMLVNLLLTSMVDILTILVVFLLVDASGQSNHLTIDGLKIPKAQKSEPVPMASVLRVEGQKYFLDNKELKLADMAQAFVALKGKELIVLADQEADFENLNPVMLASSEAGLQKFKFVVSQEEERK